MVQTELCSLLNLCKTILDNTGSRTNHQKTRSFQETPVIAFCADVTSHNRSPKSEKMRSFWSCGCGFLGSVFTRVRNWPAFANAHPKQGHLSAPRPRLQVIKAQLSFACHMVNKCQAFDSKVRSASFPAGSGICICCPRPQQRRRRHGD